MLTIKSFELVLFYCTRSRVRDKHVNEAPKFVHYLTNGPTLELLDLFPSAKATKRAFEPLCWLIR